MDASQASSILVVEDSDEDFDTMVEALRGVSKACTIHRVLSGGDCLAFLRQKSGADQSLRDVLPAVIFMDLSSHGIDGREALVFIKTDPALKTIPIIILTTSANPKDLTFCLAAGANAYHVKPARYDEYRSLLRSVLVYWLASATPSSLMAGAD